jgi:hypothetical protein
VIVENLSLVPAVESVYLSGGGSVVRVHVLINDEEESVFDAIYERESYLMRRFYSVNFDFNVIALRGRPVELVRR